MQTPSSPWTNPWAEPKFEAGGGPRGTWQLQASSVAIVSLIRRCEIRTLRVNGLSQDVTTRSFMEALTTLGTTNYDYLHVPIDTAANIRGFAFVSFPTAEEAAQFCGVIWGYRFDGDTSVTVEIALRQGAVENVQNIGSGWRKRRKGTERASDGATVGHGMPHVRVGGVIVPIASKHDRDEFVAAYTTMMRTRSRTEPELA